MSEPVSPRVTMETDLLEVSRVLVRSWRRLLAGTLMGTLIGVVVVLVFPPRFDGRALVLIRTTQGSRNQTAGV